jgi:hypothetical protein
MNRGLKCLTAALMLTCAPGVAHAQSASWIVSEASGKVTLRDGSKAEPAARGSVVGAGDIVETAAGARAVIVRGKDFVTVAPNSRIRIPEAAEAKTSLFDVIEEWGNALFQIEKKPVPHFSVQTPYLAAVVKGTTFSIIVSDEGASLQVTDGAVDTSTLDGGAHDLIRPGIVAVVSAGDRYRLNVQGQDAKVIDSPNRPTAGRNPAPSAGQQSANDATLPANAPASDDGFAASSGGQTVFELVAADPVDLGKMTGGLVRGSTANQVSSLTVASARDAIEGSGTGTGGGNAGGSDNGKGTGSGSGNGNGSGSDAGGSSGTDNGHGAGQGAAGGEGNSSGHGQGPGADNGNGADNGHGNGNGQGNGNGNGAGNGNGNGSDNGQGADAGNGNGQNSGPGAGNGNGNGSDQGNGNGNGQNSGNGNGNGADDGNGNGQNSGNGNGDGNGADDGNGNGNGQNNGNGNGNGNGQGPGSGQGNGNGQDNGNSSGQGNGNSQGNGNGNGSSNGSGNGNGGGSGKGNGITIGVNLGDVGIGVGIGSGNGSGSGKGR